MFAVYIEEKIVTSKPRTVEISLSNLSVGQSKNSHHLAHEMATRPTRFSYGPHTDA